MDSFSYKKYFPHKSPRPQQDKSIKFCLDAFLNQDKKFVVLELGTGCGKSAIGITVSRYLNDLRQEEDSRKNNEVEIEDESLCYKHGSYVLTTQKVLQQQYVSDFGYPKGKLLSIKGADNYRCKYYRNNTCGESSRLLVGEKPGSPFWKSCVFNCNYKQAKKEFMEGTEGVTNFSYFLAETMYAGKLEPRDLLIIDEAHNTELELSKFIEITISEKFANDVLKVIWPIINTQKSVIKWLNGVYVPKLVAHVQHMKKTLEKYKDLESKLSEFTEISKQFNMLDKHLCKVNRFIQLYTDDNWVMNAVEATGKAKRKFEFKPVDVSPYADEILFKHGKNVILMSATIINKDIFCESLGIKRSDVAFMSVDSPFPIENRPIYYAPAGSMSKANIDATLPAMVEIIKVILEEHKGQKGIIHTHTFKTANYIKKHIRSARLLVHNSMNRDEVIKKHFNSKKPTILLSPSLSEGIDLKDGLSEFQILCKVPFPFLGDKLVKKRMHKRKSWYAFQTAKTVVQSVGRSVRHEKDVATTYILDESWGYFFDKNKNMFPESFRKAIKK